MDNVGCGISKEKKNLCSDHTWRLNTELTSATRSLRRRSISTSASIVIGHSNTRETTSSTSWFIPKPTELEYWRDPSQELLLVREVSSDLTAPHLLAPMWEGSTHWERPLPNGAISEPAATKERTLWGAQHALLSSPGEFKTLRLMLKLPFAFLTGVCGN